MSHRNEITWLRRRGGTLVELLMAPVILGIVSTAVATMITGAGKAHQYVNTESESMSQVETAYRRIVHNLRTAQSMSSPSDGTLHSPGTLTIKTQNDSADGYASGATVTYSVSGGNLVENDQRYGTNTLVWSVSTFSVQRVGTTPTQVCITITSSTTPAVTRTIIVTCRNF